MPLLYSPAPAKIGSSAILYEIFEEYIRRVPAVKMPCDHSGGSDPRFGNEAEKSYEESGAIVW